MFPSVDKFYGDSDSIFQQDFKPVHTAKRNNIWSVDHGINVLDWLANMPRSEPNKESMENC